MTRFVMFLFSAAAVTVLCACGQVIKQNSQGAIDTQRLVSHKDVIANQPALIHRELQGLVNRAGTSILQQSAVANDLHFMLLDSARVDVFQSSSYIYLTRGMLLLAQNEGQIASALAIVVAGLERKWPTSIERLNRAAELLDGADYDPAALPAFLMALSRYNRYMRESVNSDALFFAMYEGLKDKKVDAFMPELQSYASQLSAQKSAPYSEVPDAEFLIKLDGLAVDDIEMSLLRNAEAQTFNVQDFSVSFPENWKVFKGSRMKTKLPFKTAILSDDSSSRSAMIVRSPRKRKQAMEVGLVVVDRPDAVNAADFLKRHLESVSKKSKVEREEPIMGDHWEGYLIEGRISVESKGEIQVDDQTTDLAMFSYRHIHAVVPLRNKMVILNTMASDKISSGNTTVIGATSDYVKISRGMFADIVSSVTERQAQAGQADSRRNKFAIRVHVVGEAETLQSLAKNLPFADAEAKLRVLNGMGSSDRLKADQVIKLIVVNKNGGR